MVNFEISSEDAVLITALVDRVAEHHLALKFDREALLMDLTACHTNGTPIRLRELLGADELNFFHDVLGVHRNLNRRTGKLENNFLPRFAAKES